MVQNNDLGVYQTNSDEIENIRKILSLNYERWNQLNSVNLQITAISMAMIIGAISLFGSSYFSTDDPVKDWGVIFIVNIICITLISWRYANNIINNRINRCYQKIVHCEYKLNIPHEISLLHDLEIETEFTVNTNEISRELNRHKDYAKQNYQNKTLIVQKLIDKNRFGYYASDFLDKTASLIILGLYLAEFWFAFDIAKLFTFGSGLLNNTTFHMIFVFLPFLYGFSLYGLNWEVHNGFPIHRIPTEKDIEDIYHSLSEKTQ